MTKEQIINFIREEHDRCLHLSAELSDTDEDYDYLDGVYDGRMRSLRKVRDLIQELTFSNITLSDLYKMNGSWDYNSILTVYDYFEEDYVTLEASQAISRFGDRVVRTFQGNTINVI